MRRRGDDRLSYTALCVTISWVFFLPLSDAFSESVRVDLVLVCSGWGNCRLLWHLEVATMRMEAQVMLHFFVTNVSVGASSRVVHMNAVAPLSTIVS